MCRTCNWEDFIADCDTLLEELDELPERAEDFADSVREKVSGMRGWVEENEHVTEKMVTALHNMIDGAARWNRGN